MTIGRFYGLVGAQIWCPATGKYLILKRSDEKDVGGGTWECGTGRVDQGEDFTSALRREVREELGVEVRMDFILGTDHFYRGDPIPKNEMIGLFYACSLDDPDSVRLSWEHSEHCWVTPAEAERLLSAEHWLVRVIQRAAQLRAMLPPDIIAYNHTHGFEI